MNFLCFELKNLKSSATQCKAQFVGLRALNISLMGFFGESTTSIGEFLSKVNLSVENSQHSLERRINHEKACASPFLCG